MIWDMNLVDSIRELRVTGSIAGDLLAASSCVPALKAVHLRQMFSQFRWMALEYGATDVHQSDMAADMRNDLVTGGIDYRVLWAPPTCEALMSDGPAAGELVAFDPACKHELMHVGESAYVRSGWSEEQRVWVYTHTS